VSIAAYRDSELKQTVRDLFATATNPQRVYVGIVFQGDYDADVDLCFHTHPCLQGVSADECVRMYRNGEWDWQPPPVAANTQTHTQTQGDKHIRILHMHYKQATGPCFARHLCQALYCNEDYVLQIDSHMRFRGGWDNYLIGMLEHIAHTQPTMKPILTTYPLPYHLPNSIPSDTSGTILCPSHFHSEDHLLRQVGKRFMIVRNMTTPTSTHTQTQEPEQQQDVPIIPSPLWAAGFSFSRASVIRDVPYDPHLKHLFFGEEISMAARYPICV
jgi:hypothetical protein